ncbi:MAG: extracellular solute-binding protein [Chloroflexi bacterium]|nr:extracellular solute-binding protein [Chloroflexota bacterium]
MTRRKLNRREFLYLTAGTAAGTLLAGCGPKATSVPPSAGESPADGPAPEPLGPPAGAEQQQLGWYEEWHPSSPIELLAWGNFAEGSPMGQALLDRFRRFEARYPNIKIKTEDVPGEEQRTKVHAAWVSKEGPDLTYDFDQQADHARAGIIPSISNDVMPSSWLDEHDFYSVRPLDDGKPYALMTGAMGPIMYYNKDIFDEAGYTGQDIPTTWDEFARFAKELTVWDGDTMVQAGFAFNEYARYIWIDMIYQQGGHVHNMEQALFNSPEGEQAWQTLLDFYDTHKINSREFLIWDEAFGTGKAAVAQNWTWFGDHLTHNYPTVNWRPAFYPTFTGSAPYGRIALDGPGFMVTNLAEGDRLKAAWEFFKFQCYEYQGLDEYFSTMGDVLYITPHPDYAELAAAAANAAEPTFNDLASMQLSILRQQIDAGMVFPGEISAPHDDMWTKIEDAIVFEGRPIKEVLDQYEELYTDMLQKTDFWVTSDA